MGFGRWLGRVTGLAAAASPPVFTFDAPIKPIDQMFAELRGQGVAPRVTRDEALSVSTVQRGRNLLCSVATLPLVQRGPDNTIVRNPLLEQIDPDVPNVVTLSQTIEDLVFAGVAWWKITGFGFDLFPVNAQRLDPQTVSIDPPMAQSPSSLPSGIDPREANVVWVNGEPVPVDQIIRFDSPNPAVLKVGGRAIKRAILLDQAARMYAEDPRALDYFSPADGADPADDDAIKDILDKWKDARKRRATGYVPESLEYHTVDSPSPAELQLVELQKQVNLDIANAFGVDPEDLGVSTTSRTYQNDVDRRRARINDVLAPYMRAITDRLSMGDVTKRGYLVAFDLDDYLKSNPTERWNTYKLASEMGVMDREEIREKEGLPPRDIPEPAPAAPPADPVNADRLPSIAFDDQPLRFVDVPMAEFSVDRESRTIEGLALPYGKIGSKAGLRFRFERGALQVNDVSRVKLLRDHDPSMPLGVATDLKDTPAGYRVKFKIARSAAADEALMLAEDGVLDGMSVGVDFDIAADTVPDPRNKGVALIRRADLREVSLTPIPAFEDARVTKVAASRDGKETGMPDQDEPQVAPAAPPAGVTLTNEQFSRMIDLLNNPRTVHLDPVEVTEEQRQIVNPTRLTASTSVTEAAPYRFDRRGNLLKGTHDFSSDLFAAQRGDQAAYDRAAEFVRVQFDVATGDVNELNPTRQRPDMYVDQRDFRYPIWDAINKGTLTDITPFTFPKFSSASGLVGAHTEGNEPTSGTYVTTSQTVTPTAISGKAKITRETWDQGGNPQVSNLIWRQMLKGWFESLEAAAVAVLDAASPTQIDFSGTPGLADDQLDQAITAALASLQFVRGGFTMDNLFAQIDFYKALIAATGTDGRRLYPALGPTNANGTVRSRFGALDINGVLALPAWALAASGTVTASSYLFDSGSVHGWASAPQRLEFNIEVAHVYIGIWGYKATAISDINGVREVLYDPA